MWVEVTSVGNQTGLGILDNDPVVRTDLSHREEVAFDLCDVIAIFDENSPPDSTQHGRISLDPPKCPYCRCLIDLSDYDQLASGHLVLCPGCSKFSVVQLRPTPILREPNTRLEKKQIRLAAKRIAKGCRKSR